MENVNGYYDRSHSQQAASQFKATFKQPVCKMKMRNVFEAQVNDADQYTLKSYCQRRLHLKKIKDKKMRYRKRERERTGELIRKTTTNSTKAVM